MVKCDALDTGLDAASIDKVLLFGVLPFPFLPLNRLLPEMHRVIKPEGSLAVWLFPVSGWVPKSILESGLFTYVSKRNMFTITDDVRCDTINDLQGYRYQLACKKKVLFSDINRIATYGKYDPGKSLNLRLIRSIS